MSRIINIISQIIYLSKKAKKQVEKGKYSSAKRLFKVILNIEEKEFRYIKHESGSEEFYRECLLVYKDTKTAFYDMSKWNKDEALRMLDRIIQLEKYQLHNIVKAKKGLAKEILTTIDPYIRELMNEINKLSFVAKTSYSCSGHFPFHDNLSNDWRSEPHIHHSVPYIEIEYDWQSKTRHNIKSFHHALVNIVAKTRPSNRPFGIKKVTYRLGFTIQLQYPKSEEEFKQQFIKQWNLISRLIKKYQDNDSLIYRKQRKYLKEHPKLLGQPDKLIKQGMLIIRCPQCGCYMLTKERTPKCKVCTYKFGDIIKDL